MRGFCPRKVADLPDIQGCAGSRGTAAHATGLAGGAAKPVTTYGHVTTRGQIFLVRDSGIECHFQCFQPLSRPGNSTHRCAGPRLAVPVLLTAAANEMHQTDHEFGAPPRAVKWNSGFSALAGYQDKRKEVSR